MTKNNFTIHKIVDENNETIHAFATASFALPKTHWIYQHEGSAPPMPLRMGSGPARDQMKRLITAAAKYAIRFSTMHGKEDDFDPDAMVQNFIVGLLGYNTPDGLDSDGGEYNPKEIPPEFRGLTK